MHNLKRSEKRATLHTHNLCQVTVAYKTGKLFGRIPKVRERNKTDSGIIKHSVLILDMTQMA